MTPARLPLELTSESFPQFKNLCLGTDYGQLDCPGKILGIRGYEFVLAVSIELELEAGLCQFLGIKGLITAKEAMGRPKDQETVLQLKAIKERQEG